MEQIKTFEDACRVLCLDPEAVLPDVKAFPTAHQKAITAFAKLVIVAEVLNEGWKPDWNNNDEYKYYPWFDMENEEEVNPTGFRFYAVLFRYTCSYVGSRLCFKSSDIAEYAGEKFIDLYRDLMVL